MNIAEEARKFQQDKRIETKTVRAADAPANALTAVREHLRDYLTGNKPLDPNSMLQMCNAGLA